MFTEGKVTEISYWADDFCKFFDAEQKKNMLSAPEDGISQEELSGYIDIVPYQQKGAPCYGGDTGETEYENYMKGTPELYQERDNRLYPDSY